VSFRVEFGGGAQMQFHTLPEEAKDALIERAVDLAEHPWDAVVRPLARTVDSARRCSGRATASWGSS
jgi:hypothetical protein